MMKPCTSAYPEKEVEKKLTEIVKTKCGKVPSHARSFIDTHKDERYFSGVLEEIRLDLEMGRPLRGPLLGMGSGCGAFLRAWRNNGIDAFGVEPDHDVVDVWKTIGREGSVVRPVGGHLSFRDQIFRLLTSMSVIEHVREPASVIGESPRVTSRYGAVHLTAPGYSRCFWEGHFNVFWLTLLPKRIAKFYLRLLRGPFFDYVDTLHYVTGTGIRRTAARLRARLWT
jgi:hypothetical protein